MPSLGLKDRRGHRDLKEDKEPLALGDLKAHWVYEGLGCTR
jgi:hypothetical protein